MHEVQNDRKEERRLEEDGLIKKRELAAILSSSGSAYWLPFFLLLSILPGFLLSFFVAAIVFPQPGGIRGVIPLTYFFVHLFSIIGIRHYLDYKQKPKRDVLIAPQVARFALENPQFMEILQQIDAPMAKECDRLLRVHKSQSVNLRIVA